VVGCGHYHIVGVSLVHNFQETILLAGTIGFVVKIVKQELKVDDTFFQCFDALVFSIFIELFNSFATEDLTPLPSLTKVSKDIL
jgi:hypothetical protein